MTPQEEIEELLARISMGDRQAFRALYARTSAKLFGICLHVLKDRAEAEEALQEAYLRIWDKADLYRSNGYSPMTWLITLTRNLAVDQRRRKRPAEMRDLDAADTVVDAAPGPEALAILRDSGEHLLSCLHELPGERASLVRRAYLEGVSYRELATSIGANLNTVRTWLRRSLLQLRECMSR